MKEIPKEVKIYFGEFLNDEIAPVFFLGTLSQQERRTFAQHLFGFQNKLGRMARIYRIC